MNASAPTLVPAWKLEVGTKFRASGRTFVITGFGVSKVQAYDLGTKKHYVINALAQVEDLGKDLAALGEAITDRDTKNPKPTLPAGTTVRFVDSPWSRKEGLAGVEAVIVRTNQKTYTLSNDYRVSPQLVERV